MILVALSQLAVVVGLGSPLAADTELVEVKVTQSHLRSVCLDGEPVKPGQRTWRLPAGAHSMSFTMRNEPRVGAEPHQRVVPKAGPGIAAVSFTLEAGHRYEVEVRAPVTAFSSRVWERKDWTPAVRDRTVDRVVSGEAEWGESGCGP